MTLPTRPHGGIDWSNLRKDWFQSDLNTLYFAKQVAAHTRERCAMKALEQRCERGIPWDRACVAIAAEIRKTED